ncbi:MAG TPA: T9SS type A sorting domain-containing protein [Ignavibacteria bacterium]|nr:T9SS type A sorting domain-containing protein [Ignavibacteria bacterium]HMR39487.1 T9SS type A sorting domain-containing protein [Ignavibacteria bacterium]
MKNIIATFIMVLVIGIIISGTTTQKDNPLLDQLPPENVGQDINQIPTPFVNEIDSEGYDNFNIGTDFAEVHMVTNPNNPLQSIAAWNSTGGANAYATINGLDWFATPSPSWGQQMRGDPVMAYDSLGNSYFDNMYGASILGTRIAKTTDNGLSWANVSFANIGNDKNWVAADQTGGPYKGYVYGVMTGGSVVRSTDFGISFQNVYFATNQLPGMMVCVGANVLNGANVQGGCVYVVSNTGSSTAPNWTFHRSTDGGTTWSARSTVVYANYVGTFVGGRNSVENMRTRPYPMITADNSYGPHRGRLYVTYASNSPAGDGNKPDIFTRYSDDQGATWSGETRVNDDVNSAAHNQWSPANWCDKITGKLYVQWMDTRDCPTSDSCLIYASYSTDGGVSFVTNQPVSNKKFRINCTTCGGGGTPAYLGDYNAISSNGDIATVAWTDFRAGNFGNYIGYFPDYAVKTSVPAISITNGQNATFKVSVPSVKLYSGKVKFTASVDSLPSSGTLAVSFVGKDSVTSFPDSVTVKVEAIGTVTPGRYSVRVVSRGNNGTPAHYRLVDVYVNSALVSVETDRPGITNFEVNGVSYSSRQEFIFTLGENITVAAISPRILGLNQYVYTNWSNGGDTSQTITVSSNLNLKAFYKIQYKLNVNSTQGNTFGGGIFYDSAGNATFGVNSRVIINGGTTYYFRGWTGSGTGSYTSPDSTGLDSVINITMTNPIIEAARWTTTVGINQLSSTIPDKFNLYNNYPNPFNPGTVIKFDVAKTQMVKLTVYNLLGEAVANLVNDNLSPGSYSVNFDGSNLSSGMYFYRIETQGYVQTMRMLLVK